ncbi:MAG: RsmB/NOP family class I SAM-dependent RNA methyltransferase [Pseudomonadota bacterium]
MREPGRVAAAIEILDDFEKRRVPIKTAIADWARHNRYAGAKDRAWISGLCLDVLRHWSSLAALTTTNTNRARVLASLASVWGYDYAALAALADDEHGIDPITDDELKRVTSLGTKVKHDLNHLDCPEWAVPILADAFGERLDDEVKALSNRAPIDLRINTLVGETDKTLRALKSVKARPHPFSKTAARIDAPDPAVRAPAITVIPAFNKGWVEVQDLGSQLAAAAVGSIKGNQVLDFCAGGGGKTLALAALMAGTGQLYAYDIDPKRLKPLYARAKRARIRNLQIRTPLAARDDGLETAERPLSDLKEKMDVVFVDAPCTGSGVWRRNPDSKWRLKPGQLERRCDEQEIVLDQAADFVKPKGFLVYVTCSVFPQENDAQITQFMAKKPAFSPVDALEQIQKTDLLTINGADVLKKCMTPSGALLMTPARCGTDGFFVSVLKRS